MKKESSKWGDGGIVGGKTKYDQMEINKSFHIHKPIGPNLHKSNVKTDKPYDHHIK